MQGRGNYFQFWGGHTIIEINLEYPKSSFLTCLSHLLFIPRFFQRKKTKTFANSDKYSFSAKLRKYLCGGFDYRFICQMSCRANAREWFSLKCCLPFSFPSWPTIPNWRTTAPTVSSPMKSLLFTLEMLWGHCPHGGAPTAPELWGQAALTEPRFPRPWSRDQKGKLTLGMFIWRWG